MSFEFLFYNYYICLTISLFYIHQPSYTPPHVSTFSWARIRFPHHNISSSIFTHCIFFRKFTGPIMKRKLYSIASICALLTVVSGHNNIKRIGGGVIFGVSLYKSVLLVIGRSSAQTAITWDWLSGTDKRWAKMKGRRRGGEGKRGVKCIYLLFFMYILCIFYVYFCIYFHKNIFMYVILLNIIFFCFSFLTFNCLFLIVFGPYVCINFYTIVFAICQVAMCK